MKNIIQYEEPATGVDWMDEEHDAQLTLLDALEDAMRDDDQNAIVYERFQQLIEHTELHFLSEQLAMREHDYEGYKPHLEEHERLIAHVRALQKSLIRGGRVNTPALIAALRTWLMVHMQTTDVALETFLKQKGDRARVASE